MRYRPRGIQELTGRDLAKPLDAAEVFLALECVRIIGLDAERGPRPTGGPVWGHVSCRGCPLAASRTTCYPGAADGRWQR